MAMRIGLRSFSAKADAAAFTQSARRTPPAGALLSKKSHGKKVTRLDEAEAIPSPERFS
jgi:hypothetical protein